MKLRILACVPVAALITLLLLLSASSFVSALESVVSPPFDAGRPPPTPLGPGRAESECERLFREAHALSHEATRCDATPACQASPLLCPAAQDERIERDFERLREALHARCSVPLDLMDYAWGGPAGEGPVCGGAHDWLEAASRGAASPTHFVF